MAERPGLADKPEGFDEMGRKLISAVRNRRIVGATLLSLTAFVAAGEAASAQAANFTCRASVLRLEVPPGNTLLEPVVSNNPNNPCVSDADGLPSINVLGVSAKLLQSSTSNSSTGATSQASVADVALNRPLVPVIRVQVANSQASVVCSAAGTPVFSSSSQVVGLTINGNPVVVTGQPNQTINLLGLGTIVLNQRIVAADRITRRAVVVNLPGLLRLTLAESIADVSGNPCAPPPPPPQCSDGIDNDGDGQTDYDARNDPPFHPFGDQQCTSPDDNNEAA